VIDRHIARKRERLNACNILARKLEDNRSLEVPRRSCVYIIKVNHR
jgi:hypothetical protein